MKRMIIVTTLVLGLAAVGNASAAQDGSSTTNLQNVKVSAAQGQYETDAINLRTGYELQALVGNTHHAFVQAQRAAGSSDALRARGMAPRSMVAVAIDDSTGPGTARQIQLIDAAQGTLAIVNVYCKRAAPVDGRHCQLVPQPVWNRAPEQRVASRQLGHVQLAVVGLHD